MSGASASYAPPRTRQGTRRKRTAGRTPAGTVRWDKLGRIAMLFVLLALLFLYLSAGMHMLSSWRQSRRDNAAVSTMEREHRALLSEHNALNTQSDLEIQARQLGLTRPGERTYVVTNLPRN